MIVFAVFGVLGVVGALIFMWALKESKKTKLMQIGILRQEFLYSLLSETNNGSTVAVSKEIHARIHKLCKRDDLKVKAVVNLALKEHLKGLGV